MRSRDIRRKYGQNYLTDKSVLFKMADAISPTSSDNFLEIGPGLGALTEQINKDNITMVIILPLGLKETNLLYSHRVTIIPPYL